jgi:hypothetical protein
MSHLTNYNFRGPPNLKRTNSAKALMAVQQQRNAEKIAQQLYELEQTRYITHLINQDKLFTALKHINTQFPKFKNLHPKTYKWLKKTERNNLNENNIENLTEININKFQTPKGNALEDVNVYEAFATKKGGNKTHRKKRNHRRTHKKH